MIKKKLLKLALASKKFLPPKLSEGLIRMVGDTYSRLWRGKPIYHSNPVVERKQTDQYYAMRFPEGYEGNRKMQSSLKQRLNSFKRELEGVVVEVGCADGWFSRCFARLGHKTVGVDFSSHFIRLANQYKKEQRVLNVDFLLGRAEKLPLADNSCDTVFLGEILEHVKNEQNILKEAYRVLRPGGKFIITLPTYLMAAEDHRRAISRERLEKLLKPFARIKSIFSIGVQHYGCIAIIRKK